MPNVRKPDALKVLEGTFRKDRADPGHLEVEPCKIPLAPRHLREDEAEVWNGLRKVLQPLGVVGATDLMAFEMMVRSVAKARAAFSSPDVDTKTATAAVKEARSWLREFGLTPSSRRAVRAAGGEEAERTLEDFMSLGIN